MPAVAIVAGVLVLLFFVARAGAASGRPAAPTEAIDAVANAIAIAEGFYVPGSIPSRANNPGDLKLGGNTIGSGITVFASADQGWNALYTQLVKIRDGTSSKFTPNMTIETVGQIYAGTLAGGAAWSNNVAIVLGVSIDTTIGEVLS